MSHYETLGIDRRATTAEIKASRDQLARIHHPDRNKSPDADQKMKAINEAYEVLSDEDKRAAYDRELPEMDVMAEYEAIGKKIRKSKQDIANRVGYLLTILPGVEKEQYAEVLNPANQPPLLTTIVGYGTADMLKQILPYYTKEELRIALNHEDKDGMDSFEHLTCCMDDDDKSELLFTQFDIEERWALIEPHVKSLSFHVTSPFLKDRTKLASLDKMFFNDELYFAELDKEITKFKQLNTEMSESFADALLILRTNLFNFAEQQKNDNLPLIQLQQTPEMQLLRDTISLVKNLSSDKISEYQLKTSQQTYSESSVLMRVIGLVLITAACVILGALIGIGIGMLAGAWTGPGAAITAVLGLVKGTMSGAALGLTIGTALTGLTAASVSGYLLFKPHQLKADTEAVISAANNYSTVEI